ncbi:hypothetical protein F4818DRAFT_347893 [Hypoxylon cercidicola]|nr:hypothetical protein F4818DRAFT_347893 [Hypoxylon cercidicola]
MAQENHSYPTQQGSSSYFVLPTIETTEDIAAGIQFDRPPPTRHAFHNSTGRQKNSSLQSVPNTQSAYQSVLNYGPAESARRQELLQPKTYKDDVPDPGVESRGINAVEAAVESQGSLKQAVHTSPPSENIDKPDSISNRNTPGLPFPDEIQSPRSNMRKNIPSRSLLANSTLPKSIVDTRQRALAQLSPHSRALIAKSRLSSSGKAQYQPSRALDRPGNADSIEGKQSSRFSGSSETLEELLEDSHVGDVQRTSKTHPQAKQQKIQSLTRPIPGRCLGGGATTSRPRSQVSNISKPRTPVQIRHRETPFREQYHLNLKHFSKAWNKNCEYNQKLLDRWERKMGMQEEYIKDCKSTIEQYRIAIEARDQTINTLSKETEEQRTQSQAVNDEIAAASAVRKKLEDKLRACRARLNDAVDEQQQLFLRCRQHFQETTAKIKEESQFQKDSVEKFTARVELVRAEINQGVVAVANGVHTQVDELNKTIESLEAKLGQSEQELERQRDHAASLLEQLAESHKLNEQSLQSVAAQNRELLEKLNRDRQQADETDRRIQEQGQKIDKVLTDLAEAKSRTVDYVALEESLRGVHNDTVNAIVAEIQISAQSAHSSALNDRQSLSDNLDQIRILCNGISDGMSEAKNVAEWQTRASEADTTVRDQVHQIQNLQDELNQTRILVQDKLEEQLELQSQLGILQTHLSEKDAAVAGFEKDLAATQEELRTQARRLRDKEEQIQNERQSHTQAIEYSARERNQAISRAVAEETERLREEHERKERQLQAEAGRERAQLEQELVNSRQAVEAENRLNIGEDIRHITGELAAANTSITELKADLEESEHQREALQERLEQWSRDRDAIGQMQQMLQRLAKEQPNAKQMSSELTKLTEMQRKISGTVEYHQVHLANTKAAVAAKQAQQNDGTTTPSKTKSNPTNGQQNSTDHLLVESQNLKRKVMVKSPAIDDDRASPVSIEQERNARRQSVPPRGIMKSQTPSASGELEATATGAEIDSQMPEELQPPPKRKIAKRGSKPIPNARSLYNRLVSGSVLGTSQEQEDATQVGSSSGHKSDATVGRATSDGASDPLGFVQDAEEPPMKRQRTSEVNQQPDEVSYHTPGTKLARSMTEYFPAQEPEDRETTQMPQATSSRGGPIERRLSGLVTYGLSSLRGSRSNSQLSLASSQTLAASDEDD